MKKETSSIGENSVKGCYIKVWWLDGSPVSLGFPTVKRHNKYLEELFVVLYEYFYDALFRQYFATVLNLVTSISSLWALNPGI